VYVLCVCVCVYVCASDIVIERRRKGVVHLRRSTGERRQDPYPKK
jgi:hypothetical protein